MSTNPNTTPNPGTPGTPDVLRFLHDSVQNPALTAMLAAQNDEIMTLIAHMLWDPKLTLDQVHKLVTQAINTWDVTRGGAPSELAALTTLACTLSVSLIAVSAGIMNLGMREIQQQRRDSTSNN